MNTSAHILAIETSTSTGSVALVKGLSVLIEQTFTSDRSHNCDLFAPLGKVLKTLDGAKLSQIIVGTGPGSYGGTRVGIAAAQGISTVHGCPVAGIQSFEAIPEAQDEEECWMLGDARRSQYYAAQLCKGALTSEKHQLLSKESFEEKIIPLIDSGIDVFSLDPPSRFAQIGIGESTIRQVTPQASLLIKRWASWTTERQKSYNDGAVEPAYLAPPHITLSTKGRGLQSLRK